MSLRKELYCIDINYISPDLDKGNFRKIEKYPDCFFFKLENIFSNENIFISTHKSEESGCSAPSSLEGTLEDCKNYTGGHKLKVT